MITFVLVGRPNVGKSSLFNCMIRERKAIVHPMPGVTRDWLEGVCVQMEPSIRVIDTGGIEEPRGLLGKDIRRSVRDSILAQTKAGLTLGDSAILVVDGREGVTPLDQEISLALRQKNIPFVVAVNKIDEPKLVGLTNDFFELSPHVYAVSAAHTRGIEELLKGSLAFADAPLTAAKEEESASRNIPIVAIMGKPNVGKSTLLNLLCGEERVLVSEIPGTTRDAITVRVKREEQVFHFVDTAGLRRKARIQAGIEQLAVNAGINQLEKADIAIVLLDVKELILQRNLSLQDSRVASLAERKGAGVIFALNKWDALTKEERQEVDIEDFFALRGSQFEYVPLITLSAKTGLRVDKLFALITKVYQERTKRISTGELNRSLQRALGKFPGASTLRAPYFTQIETAPPTFVCKVRGKIKRLKDFELFLVHTIRDHWGFLGSPIRIFVRMDRD